MKHSRKSSHYFILWARQRHRDNQQHHRPAGAQFCRRLLLGTWNKRTLVLDLAPPQLPPSEQPNRLAKNCEGRGRIRKRRSNPSLPCSILPPARPCAGPSNRASLSLTSTGNRALLGTRGPSTSNVPPVLSVGSQSHKSPSYPCLPSISAFLAEESCWPVKRRPSTWVSPQSDLKDQGTAPRGHHCGFLDSVPESFFWIHSLPACSGRSGCSAYHSGSAFASAPQLCLPRGNPRCHPIQP